MPGHVFGQGGENYIRLSLSLSDEQIDILIKKLELLNNDLKSNQKFCIFIKFYKNSTNLLISRIFNVNF